MSTKLFHSIYSYASKLGCDMPRKNLLEEIKNKIRKIDIFSAIYINIKVVTTSNSKIGLQRSLQNLMLDFSKKKNLKSVKNSAQKMILNLVFLFHSTVQRCDPRERVSGNSLSYSRRTPNLHAALFRLRGNVSL